MVEWDAVGEYAGVAALLGIVGLIGMVESWRRRRVARRQARWARDMEALSGAVDAGATGDADAPTVLPDEVRRWLRRVGRALTVASALAALTTTLLALSLLAEPLDLAAGDDLMALTLLSWWALLLWWAFGALMSWWSWGWLLPILLTVGTLGALAAEVTIRGRLREAYGPLGPGESRLVLYGL